MNTQDNSIELGENLSNCLNCPESIDKTDFYLKYDVCPFCNFHYSIDSKKRIQIISDSGTFREFNKNISIKRPENLKIDDTYRKNVKKTRERTGLEEAAISGTCNIGGIKTVVIILDFGFLGGSMGLIVGEKISKAFSFAYRNNLPVVSIISSGGKRVQEGLYSLVQMIKTVISTKDLRRRNLPHITLFTNPSGGQVYSSFASRADIKLGEPGAIMGLFQLDELMNVNEEVSNVDISSETFYEKGLIDKVVSRNNLKIELFTILENLMIDYKIPKKVAEIPIALLAENAPIYDRPWKKTKLPQKLKFDKDEFKSLKLSDCLKKILSNSNISDKKWIWDQYDHTVMGDTIQKPGGDAGVVRVHGTNKAVAASVDSSALYCFSHPLTGGKQIVCESYRNLISVGAKPIAITNCLNFGNPEKEKNMGEFVECVEGISEASKYLDFPVVSGNV